MKNLEIQFNTSVIKKVKSLHFQVDQLGSVLFILFALYEDRVDLLDEFDDFNKQKRAIMLYEEMAIKGIISQKENIGPKDAIYELTKEGMELVEFIKSQHTDSESITSEKIAVVGVEQLKEMIQETTDVESWIDEWIDIFPRGIKSGGRLVRGDRASCLRKMKVFLREYEFERDVILEATRKYMNAKAQDNYAYTRCAVYFIYRVDGGSRSEKISDLASWCEDVLHNKTEGNTTSENNFEFMA